jgi:hypothetical protein
MMPWTTKSERKTVNKPTYIYIYMRKWDINRYTIVKYQPFIPPNHPTIPHFNDMMWRNNWFLLDVRVKIFYNDIAFSLNHLSLYIRFATIDSLSNRHLFIWTKNPYFCYLPQLTAHLQRVFGTNHRKDIQQEKWNDLELEPRRILTENRVMSLNWIKYDKLCLIRTVHLKSVWVQLFQLRQLWCLLEKSYHDCKNSYESLKTKKRSYVETLLMRLCFP